MSLEPTPDSSLVRWLIRAAFRFSLCRRLERDYGNILATRGCALLASLDRGGFKKPVRATVAASKLDFFLLPLVLKCMAPKYIVILSVPGVRVREHPERATLETCDLSDI